MAVRKVTNKHAAVMKFPGVVMTLSLPVKFLVGSWIGGQIDAPEHPLARPHPTLSPQPKLEVCHLDAWKLSNLSKKPKQKCWHLLATTAKNGAWVQLCMLQCLFFQGKTWLFHEFLLNLHKGTRPACQKLRQNPHRESKIQFLYSSVQFHAAFTVFQSVSNISITTQAFRNFQERSAEITHLNPKFWAGWSPRGVWFWQVVSLFHLDVYWCLLSKFAQCSTIFLSCQPCLWPASSEILT